MCVGVVYLCEGGVPCVGVVYLCVGWCTVCWGGIPV